MKKIGRSFLLFFLVLTWTSFSHAEVQFEATVNRNKVTKDDNLTLTLSLSSDHDVTEDDEPRLPSLDGFELLNKWTQTESQSIYENGQAKYVRKFLFRYTLSPQKKGTLVIGQAEIKANGQLLKTKPIKITVVADSSQIPPSQRQQAQDDDEQANPFGGFDQDDENDLFSQLLRRRGLGKQANPQAQPPGQDQDQESDQSGAVAGQSARDPFFIGVDVPKKKLYVGEELVATWYLYVKGNVQATDFLKYPDLKGFWKEDLEMATRLNFQPQIVNGVQYQRALLVAYALFPISPGTKVLDEYKLKATVLQMNSPMAMFGFGTPVSIVRDSKKIPIEVVPLPEQGKPANFSGAVGHFNVSGSLGSTQGKVNQPISLKIRLSGEGNVKAIELPALNLPKSIELYDTKKDSKFQRNGEGSKEFELLLIPREAGDLTIPSITFNYFDPKTAKYVSSQTPSFPIKVVPADPGSANNFSSPLAQSPAVESKSTSDIKSLKTMTTLALPPEVEKPLWLTLFIALYAGFGWLIYKTVRNQAGGHTAQLKKRIKKKLEAARSKLKTNDFRGVGIESSNAVLSTLSEVTGLSAGSLPIEQTLSSLPGKKAALQDQTRKFLNRCEIVSFAPAAMAEQFGKDDRELKKIISEAETLIADLFALDKPEKPVSPSASSSEDQRTS